MLTLLSPAKKLLQLNKPYDGTESTPIFQDKALILAGIMKSKSRAELSELMDLSKDLAELNYNRYQVMDFKDKGVLSYPALFLFQGDVYQGLQAKTWNAQAVRFSQSHLSILSGLYGLLKPLDAIQPYRLEMGVHLANPAGNTLYDFWRDEVTNALNQQLASHKNPILINLASTEYFKAVAEKAINYRIVTVNFYEHKNNETKMIGVYAKKARGTMAKFIMQYQIDELAEIKKFTDLGYQFTEQSSTDTELCFIRNH